MTASFSTAPQAAADLFPAGIALSLREDKIPDTALSPAEQQASRHMAPARREAFAQGRWCAHDSLRQLGLDQQDIPVGEQRAPLWPPGIVGSISHCDGMAVAVAARAEVAAALGVDLEQPGELEVGVRELICTPAERRWLEQTGVDQARLLFAIKESIYKCVWPRVRRFVDFQEVEVTVCLDTCRWTAAAVGDAMDAQLVSRLSGGFGRFGDYLLTSAYLPPSSVL